MVRLLIGWEISRQICIIGEIGREVLVLGIRVARGMEGSAGENKEKVYR
jgi:hypothetical protein